MDRLDRYPVFDISIAGLDPNKLGYWLLEVSVDNSPYPEFLEINNELCGIELEVEGGFTDDTSLISETTRLLEFRIIAPGRWRDARKSEGLSEDAIDKLKIERIKEYPNIYINPDGKSFENNNWAIEILGWITIYSIINGTQVIGLTIKYKELLERIADWIISVYSPHAHKNPIYEKPPSGKGKVIYPDIDYKNNNNDDWKPWEKIQEHGSDQMIIQYWCEGWTAQTIAKRLGYVPEYVTNQISELRKKYPQAKIPRDEERKRKRVRLSDNL